MNKRIFSSLLVISGLLFCQNASAVTFNAAASVTIVENPGVIKPESSGGFSVMGGDNNAQIAYLDKSLKAKGLKYSELKGNKKYSPSNHFSVQYE